MHDPAYDDGHVHMVHPVRAMMQNHCYLDGLLDFEKNGMALLMMDALILVPIIMFAFFYPVQVLMWVGGVALFIAAIYESCVIWKKWHTVRS